MGCDIHAHIEVMIDGKWEHWGAPRIARRYSLFARMAGVRPGGGVKPMARPRGIPPDATRPTMFAHNIMGSDAHGESWLNASEFADLIAWYDAHRTEEGGWFSWEHTEIGYFNGNGWSQFSRYRDELPEGATDCRIIFWFDN